MKTSSVKNAVRLIVVSVLFFASCTKNTVPSTDPTPLPDKDEDSVEVLKGDFAKGADISWVTQMESEGLKFYTASGKEMECTALMKEIGFDAIRLRVWVNPEDGWSGKDDVLVKAKRAQALGMRLMIDFHYSDSWADPSKQVTPAQWKDYNVQEMTDAVKAHTSEVLQLLKTNNIDVEWVQMGNEVNGGMLHPLGKVQGSVAQNFVKFVNAAGESVKKIYPEAKTIIHVSNGHDSGLFNWFFDLMRINSAKYDIIGMSLYPMWWENGAWCQWKPNIDACISNIKAMVKAFAKPVMICETGMPVNEPQASKEALQYLLDNARKIEDCHGVFYWEPQAPDKYNGGYDKGAFKDGRPTIALDPFK